MPEVTREEALSAIKAKPKNKRTLAEVVYLLQVDMEQMQERIAVLESAATEPENDALP